MTDDEAEQLQKDIDQSKTESRDQSKKEDKSKDDQSDNVDEQSVAPVEDMDQQSSSNNDHKVLAGELLLPTYIIALHTAHSCMLLSL